MRPPPPPPPPSDALANPLDSPSGRSRRVHRVLHVSALHHLEAVSRELMEMIERENAPRRAILRLSTALHGDSSTYRDYQWTDTPAELLRTSRETVQVRFRERASLFFP